MDSREEKEKREAGLGKYGVLYEPVDEETKRLIREEEKRMKRIEAEQARMTASARIGDKLASEVGREWTEMEKRRAREL